VVRLSALASLLQRKRLVFIELEAGWLLELVWMFWRMDSSFVSLKICTPDIPDHIQVTTDYAALY